MGFYIARFVDDPNDTAQKLLVRHLEDLIAEQKIKNVEVKRLPRRIQDETQARKLALDGNAALVLWMKRLTPPIEA